MTFLSKILNISSERYLKTAGDLFIYQGDYEAALHMVEKTLAVDPDEVRALVLRGDILYCLNRDEDALESFSRALALDPANVEAWISRAGVLDVLGRPRDALACCQEAFRSMRPRKAYLLPCLFEQNLSILIELKRYRPARDLLDAAETQLHRKEYKALLANYGYALDALLQERRQIFRRARRLSMRLV